MEASLVEERKLMEENLDLEYALILDTNKRLLEAGDDQARSEEEILIELNKKNLSCGVSMTRNLRCKRARY